jgi:hypothetical protein
MAVPTELDKLGLEPPAWGDRHDLDWEDDPAPAPAVIDASTIVVQP